MIHWNVAQEATGEREAKWDMEDGPGENKPVITSITGAIQPETPSALPGIRGQSFGAQVSGHAAEGCGLHMEEVRSGLAEPQMSGVESSHSEACCFNPPSSISASCTGLLSGWLPHSCGLSLFSIPLPSKLWCSLI